MSDSEYSVHARAREYSVEDWTKYVINTADSGSAEAHALAQLPPVEVQRITQGKEGRDCLQHAADIYVKLYQLIQQHLDQAAPVRILDFGCGWGRISRFMIQLTEPENIYGVDVDPTLIEWCERLLPRMTFATIESGDPVPFDDGQFDLVISNSVFSHLSLEYHHRHIADIARVLRLGGLFLGTTLGQRSINQMYNARRDWIEGFMGPKDQTVKKFEADGFVYGSGNKRWPNYGIAFINPTWVERNWAPKLRIIGRSHGGQTINAARRMPD